MKKQKIIFQTIGNQKIAGVDIIRQRDFQEKKDTEDKADHYIMVKRLFHHDDITIVNTNGLNTTTPLNICKAKLIPINTYT